MAVNIVLTAILRANVTQFLNGLTQAGRGLQGVSNIASALSKAFDAFLITKFIGLLLQLKDALGGIIFNLLETAGKWQQMTIGMSAVIMSTNKITDATGKQLTYAEQFQRSILISKDLMQKLQVDAALNVGTTEELAAAFTGLANAVSTTSKAGEDGISKTRALANTLVATSHILGPMVLKGGTDQAIRETNELLEGRLTKINTLARALGLTTGAGKEAFKAAYKAGSVYDFLMGKLKAYTEAQKYLADSFTGLSQTFQDMFELAKKGFAQFGFERVNASLRQLRDYFITELPDGTAKVSDAFTHFIELAAPLFDELLIPLLRHSESWFAVIDDNKDSTISFMRVITQLLGLMFDLATLLLDVIRPLLNLLGVGLAATSDSLSTLIGLVRGLVNWVDDLVRAFNQMLKPALDMIHEQIIGKLQPAVQWLLSKLGLSTDLQEKNKEKQKEATDAANTHAVAIGNVGKELDDNNKKVKDNTQHWKNWINTMRAAYSNRFPAAAKSFLTMFGAGGTLSPSAAGAGSVPVNINLNGPHGTTTIPAQMTPQQLAQAHRNGKQFSGALGKMTKGISMNPAGYAGPVFQN